MTLGREETFLVYLSIKNLVESNQLKSARLFGQCFGTEKNYLIVETERSADDAGDEEIEEQDETVESLNPASGNFEGTVADSDDPDAAPAPYHPPKSTFKAPVFPQKEIASGSNRYVYWVTSDGCH